MLWLAANQRAAEHAFAHECPFHVDGAHRAPQCGPNPIYCGSAEAPGGSQGMGERAQAPEALPEASVSTQSGSSPMHETKRAYSFTKMRLGLRPRRPIFVPTRTNLQRQARAAHKLEETQCGHPPGFKNPPEVP